MFAFKTFLSRFTRPFKLTVVKPAKTQDELLIMELSNLRDKIESCRSRFDLLSDEDLTEACIYELSSLQSQYRYLLKKVKEARIRCQFVKQMELERTG